MSAELAQDLIAAAIRLIVPILLAALGELIAERAGVVNIGVEGMMLSGALVAAITASTLHSGALGIVAGVVVGALLALGFAWVAVVAGGDAIVTGTALNLFALGGTGFVYRVFYARGAGFDVAIAGPVTLPLLSDLPGIGSLLFRQPLMTWLTLLAVLLAGLFLSRTGFGLRVIAAGEAPSALAAVGVDPMRVRLLAVVAGGALAGAGGAALVVGHAGVFVEGMTAGRGFIALSLVICAGWRPQRLPLVGLLFGLALALQYELQARGLAVPYQFVRMVPYVATLLVLALSASARSMSPAALGSVLTRRSGARRQR